jgi:hypothetical protein
MGDSEDDLQRAFFFVLAAGLIVWDSPDSGGTKQLKEGRASQ